MYHVDYDRWYLVTRALAELLPGPFVHVDAACGTGVLIKMLRKDGWPSVGFDLSLPMIRQGRKGRGSPPAAAVADLRALPLSGSVDYVTCLFDSVNFLLDEADLRRALNELAGALSDGGILYFDVVTERMVLEHFADQCWEEKNDTFTSTWECDYDRKTATAETRIRVNNGPEMTIYERIYEQEVVADAVKGAGLRLLGAFDAQSWRSPRKRTVRIDFVAVKGECHGFEKVFRRVQKEIRSFFR
jgi:SAM-dependent methyltransferase